MWISPLFWLRNLIGIGLLIGLRLFCTSSWNHCCEFTKSCTQWRGVLCPRWPPSGRIGLPAASSQGLLLHALFHFSQQSCLSGLHHLPHRGGIKFLLRQTWFFAPLLPQKGWVFFGGSGKEQKGLNWGLLAATAQLQTGWKESAGGEIFPNIPCIYQVSTSGKGLGTYFLLYAGNVYPELFESFSYLAFTCTIKQSWYLSQASHAACSEMGVSHMVLLQMKGSRGRDQQAVVSSVQLPF